MHNDSIRPAANQHVIGRSNLPYPPPFKEETVYDRKAHDSIQLFHRVRCHRGFGLASIVVTTKSNPFAFSGEQKEGGLRQSPTHVT